MTHTAPAVITIIVFVVVSAIVPGAGSYALFSDAESITVGFTTDVSTERLAITELAPVEPSGNLSEEGDRERPVEAGGPPAVLLAPSTPMGNASGGAVNGSHPAATAEPGPLDQSSENGTVNQPPPNPAANGSTPDAEGGSDDSPVDAPIPEPPANTGKSSSEQPRETLQSDPDDEPTADPDTTVDLPDTPDDTDSEQMTGVDASEPATTDEPASTRGEGQSGTGSDDHGEAGQSSDTSDDTQSEPPTPDKPAVDDAETSSSRTTGTGDTDADSKDTGEKDAGTETGDTDAGSNDAGSRDTGEKDAGSKDTSRGEANSEPSDS